METEAAAARLLAGGGPGGARGGRPEQEDGDQPPDPEGEEQCRGVGGNEGYLRDSECGMRLHAG